VTSDWRSAGRHRQLRILGRACFIACLPFFVEVNSQIAFWPSGDDRYSRIISCPCGEARYEVIICFMGLYAKRCLLYFSGTLPCIQDKGKGRGCYLYGWVALLSGADVWESQMVEKNWRFETLPRIY